MKEQKALMAKELGMVIDELVIGELPENIESNVIGEVGEEFLIAMGKTFQES